MYVCCCGEAEAPTTLEIGDVNVDVGNLSGEVFTDAALKQISLTTKVREYNYLFILESLLSLSMSLHEKTIYHRYRMLWWKFRVY